MLTRTDELVCFLILPVMTIAIFICLSVYRYHTSWAFFHIYREVYILWRSYARRSRLLSSKVLHLLWGLLWRLLILTPVAEHLAVYNHSWFNNVCLSLSGFEHPTYHAHSRRRLQQLWHRHGLIITAKEKIQHDGNLMNIAFLRHKL